MQYSAFFLLGIFLPAINLVAALAAVKFIYDCEVSQ